MYPGMMQCYVPDFILWCGLVPLPLSMVARGMALVQAADNDRTRTRTRTRPGCPGRRTFAETQTECGGAVASIMY